MYMYMCTRGEGDSDDARAALDVRRNAGAVHRWMSCAVAVLQAVVVHVSRQTVWYCADCVRRAMRFYVHWLSTARQPPGVVGTCRSRRGRGERSNEALRPRLCRLGVGPLIGPRRAPVAVSFRFEGHTRRQSTGLRSPSALEGKIASPVPPGLPAPPGQAPEAPPGRPAEHAAGEASYQ